MGKGEVAVLGVNGHLGQAVAAAFAAAGWQVTGIARRQAEAPAGVKLVVADAADPVALRAAIGTADVVVNALNLPYHQWDQGRMEAQTARVIAALGSSGKTVLFPGNIYNFAGSDRLVTPDLQQHPQTPRGGIRVRVEQLYAEAAARGDVQAIILRAGDFYGPHSRGDWFDQAILQRARRGVVQTMGASGVGHAWAYLPDLARAFESLASLRQTLGGFERFHFAGHFVTPEQMGATIAAAAPVPVKIRRFPLWIFSMIGLVSPVLREIAKMRYLWENAMELRDERLEALLGPNFGTPFRTAIAATIAPYFGDGPETISARQTRAA